MNISGKIILMLLGAAAAILLCRLMSGCLGADEQPHTGPDGITWDFGYGR